MKKMALVFSLMFVLGAASNRLLAATSQPDADDTVSLKDGRVLHGQVVEEDKDNVVVLVQGVQRKFSRNFIKKVVYGSGPVEPAEPAFNPSSSGVSEPTEPALNVTNGGPNQPAPPAGTVPSVEPSGDLVSDLALRYRVPVSDVIWVRRQGIPDGDLSMLFLVAATARVVPRAIVKMRLAGLSWNDIEDHYGMNPQDVYYEPGPWGAYPYYYYPVGLGWWGGWGWGGGGGYYGGHWGGGGGHWGHWR